MLGAGALGRPRGMVWGGRREEGRPRGMVWGGRREEGSGWGTHVYLWRIHFDIWQNQYNTVKFKNKIKLKKEKRIRERKQRKKLENLVSLVVIKWWDLSYIYPRLLISEVSGFLP